MLAMISHQNNFYFIDSQNLTPKLTKALVKRAQHFVATFDRTFERCCNRLRGSYNFHATLSKTLNRINI